MSKQAKILKMLLSCSEQLFTWMVNDYIECPEILTSEEKEAIEAMLAFAED